MIVLVTSGCAGGQKILAQVLKDSWDGCKFLQENDWEKDSIVFLQRSGERDPPLDHLILAVLIDIFSGFFPSDSLLWIFTTFGDPVFRQETDMDMREPTSLFDDIALSGRFSDVLDELPLVPASFREGALFDDIHALARCPQTSDIAEGPLPASRSNEFLTSATDEPRAGQVADETMRPSMRNGRPQVVRPHANGTPRSRGMRPASLSRKQEGTWDGVVRQREPWPRGPLVSCRGPPASLQQPSIHP